ncbi:tRNA1(Val) (adenine(37)-N6)-methyltransferase [Amaricoccus solimangrovi]|uniref:Methyltransferase n=1 Tax=Amaricoccus solimangrovi TaxID=2589815 RepID=A0A501WNJ2_9RHOB|nr:methyltransferase [Amaricoccus solimangrovi]TPE48857.1 methyltransferase [Amaricoccus solimangrovi]
MNAGPGEEYHSEDEEYHSEDAFLGGRLTIRQPRAGYRAATDPVLLAAFTPARPGERVLELGCGAGVAVLCLGARVPGIELRGLETQPAYAALARENARANGIALTVHEGDLRRPPPELRALVFDHVIANPPFYPRGAATAPRDPGRETAHVEEATLGDWISAGLRRLRDGGWLTLIHRAERLGGILAALEGRAGSVLVLPVAPRAGRPAGRVLVRARKGAGGPLVLASPLIVHRGESHGADGGGYAPETERVLREGAALEPGDAAKYR